MSNVGPSRPSAIPEADVSSRVVSVRLGIRTAIHTFRAQPLRAVLAMSGVFLGALLLTGITHVLGGIALQIEAQARSLGADVATVSPERPGFSRRPEMRSSSVDFDEEETGTTEDEERYVPLDIAATLTPGDLETVVDRIPYVTDGVPFVTFDDMVFHGRKRSSCSVMGVTPAYTDMHFVTPAVGRFFNESEEARGDLVCVLGDAIARRLFGLPESAQGEHVRIRRSMLLVLGVMQPRGADSSGKNMDEIIFTPARTGMQRLSSQDHVAGFYLKLRGRAFIPALDRALNGLLRKQHNLSDIEGNDFSINYADQVDDMMADAMDLMTTLGFIGAGISFFVGTLGIFSIMILMVHARKVEIGIRRAIGAPQRLILQQFLFESGMIAGAGGALGVLVAIVVVEGLAFWGILPGYLNIPLALGVCLLSSGCGVLAGGYPAWKAANLEVLAALRSDS